MKNNTFKSLVLLILIITQVVALIAFFNQKIFLDNKLLQVQKQKQETQKKVDQLRAQVQIEQRATLEVEKNSNNLENYTNKKIPIDNYQQKNPYDGGFIQHLEISQ
jgi:uncharacterized membrane protein (DUF106 family)